MRSIFLLLASLLLLGWTGYCWEASPVSDAAQPPRWVRTVDGWERSAALDPSEPVYAPPLHPLVVGLLQLLVSLTALTAFTPQPAPRSPPLPSPRVAGAHRDSGSPRRATGRLPLAGEGKSLPVVR